MIGFATPARRSCVTVDARRRLCAGCTNSGTAQHSGLAGIVCLYGRRRPDHRRRSGVTLVHTPQSLAVHRPGSSCPLVIG